MNDETTGAAEQRNEAPHEAAGTNETPKQDEFDRLASLPDRHEIRIVCAEEKGSVSLALRHEDFGKPGQLAEVLASGVKIAVVRMSKELAMVLKIAGCKTSMQVKTEAAQ